MSRPRPKVADDGSNPPYLVLGAGPLYADYRTAPSDLPRADTHKVYGPDETWEKSRSVGGTAWKFIRHWLLRGFGQAIFVSWLPRPLIEHVLALIEHLLGKNQAGKDRIPGKALALGLTALLEDHAFVDDEGWLRHEIDRFKEELAADSPTRCPLVTHLKDGRPRTASSFTFHVPSVEETRRLWPIFTIDRGASQDFSWQDIVDAWQASRERIQSHLERGGKVIVFLSGVLRTGVFASLSAALERQDPQTLEILKNSTLIIEFGRTDLRTPPDRQIDRHSRPASINEDEVRRCVREAQWVFVDHATASALKLLDADNLPRKQLIVRPHGVLPGKWYCYRRASGDSAVRVERALFSSPALPDDSPRELDGTPATMPQARDSSEQLDSGRPARDAELVHRLCAGDPLDQQGAWSVYTPIQDFRTPEEFTRDAKFQKDLFRFCEKVRLDQISCVLIQGPIGSGKGEIAKLLSRRNERRKSNFVLVHCATIPDGTRGNSLLFGDANAGVVGKFQLADGGVLQLDDLDTFSLVAQAMVLGVLDSKSVTSLGSNAAESADVLVIVTTNKDPEELVKQGKLRADLYSRLKREGILVVPALKDRREDALWAGQRYWDELNNLKTLTLTRPRSLDDFLREAPLRYNYRDVYDIVTQMHDHCQEVAEKGGVVDVHTPLPDLSVHLRESVAQPSIQRAIITHGLDRILEVILEAIRGLERTDPTSIARSQVSDPAGSANPRVQRLAEAVRLLPGSAPDDPSRVTAFLDLWEKDLAEHPDDERKLKLTDVMRCLGLDGKKRATILRALEKHKKAGRLRIVGQGRSACWELVTGGAADPGKASEEGE